MPDGKVGEGPGGFKDCRDPRIRKPVPASLLQYTESLCREKPSICLDFHVLHGKDSWVKEADINDTVC